MDFFIQEKIIKEQYTPIIKLIRLTDSSSYESGFC